MWLASAALSAHNIGQFSGGCNNEFLPDWWNAGCSETKAIVAFSFLNWIARASSHFSLLPFYHDLIYYISFLAVTAYIVLLLTMCIFAANKGGPVWTTSVKEANFAPSMNMHMTGATRLGTPDYKGQISAPRQSYPPQQPGYHLNHV